MTKHARYYRRHRERRLADNARRVRIGDIYLGVAPTAEQAVSLTNLGREFRDAQKQSRE